MPVSIRRSLAAAGAAALVTTGLISPTAQAQSSAPTSLIAAISKSSVARSSATSAGQHIGSERMLKVLKFGVTTQAEADACRARYGDNYHWTNADCSVEVITEQQYLYELDLIRANWAYNSANSYLSSR